MCKLDMMDSALLRPEYIDTLLYVPFSDPAGRASNMRMLVRNVPIRVDVDKGAIGERNQWEDCSGADLALLVSLAESIHCVHEMSQALNFKYQRRFRFTQQYVSDQMMVMI
jgi:SpoVK/Ycf46/Vps4 family AAA+-type ATPase